MKKIRILLIALCTFGMIQAQDMYIVLLAGQSNMAGRGVYSQLADTTTYSNILSLNKDSVWVRAKHPLHWDKAEAAVGMGIQFAHRLALAIGGNVKIGLVPCAAGGTSIDNWLSSTYIFNYNGNNFNLYTNLIKRAKRAAKSGQIIGMIWHQGESDATAALYPTYRGKLKNLFVRIRTDLNIPNMPIVAGELGTYLATNTSCPRWDSINVQINRLKNELPYYAVASSASLTPNSDNTHFTAGSQIFFGNRYANLFYPLASGITLAQNPRILPVKISVNTNSIHFSMDSNSSAKIKIYNSLGKIVKSVDTTEQEADITTTSLKGIYIVNIQNKDYTISEKVIL